MKAFLKFKIPLLLALLLVGCNAEEKTPPGYQILKDDGLTNAPLTLPDYAIRADTVTNLIAFHVDGVSIVTIQKDGNVIYDTNRLTETSRAFWDAVSKLSKQ